MRRKIFQITIYIILWVRTCPNPNRTKKGPNLTEPAVRFRFTELWFLRLGSVFGSRKSARTGPEPNNGSFSPVSSRNTRIVLWNSGLDPYRNIPVIQVKKTGMRPDSNRIKFQNWLICQPTLDSDQKKWILVDSGIGGAG